MATCFVPERASNLFPIDVFTDSDLDESDTDIASFSCRTARRRSDDNGSIGECGANDSMQTAKDIQALLTASCARQETARCVAANGDPGVVRATHAESAAPLSPNTFQYICAPRSRQSQAPLAHTVAAAATIGLSKDNSVESTMSTRDLVMAQRHLRQTRSGSPSTTFVLNTSISIDTAQAAKTQDQAHCDPDRLPLGRSGDANKQQSHFWHGFPKVNALKVLAESPQEYISLPRAGYPFQSALAHKANVHLLYLSVDEEPVEGDGDTAAPMSIVEGSSDLIVLQSSNVMSSNSAVERLTSRNAPLQSGQADFNASTSSLRQDSTQHPALYSSADTTTQLSSCSSAQASSTIEYRPAFARKPETITQQAARIQSTAGISHLFRSNDSEYTRLERSSNANLEHDDDEGLQKQVIAAEVQAATPQRAKSIFSCYGIPECAPQDIMEQQDTSIGEYLRDAAIVEMVDYSEAKPDEEAGVFAEVMQPGSPPELEDAEAISKSDGDDDAATSKSTKSGAQVQAAKDRTDSENTLRAKREGQQEFAENNATIVQSRRVAAPTFVKPVQVMGKAPRQRNVASPAVRDMLATDRVGSTPVTTAQTGRSLSAASDSVETANTTQEIVEAHDAQASSSALDRDHIMLPGHFGSRATARGSGPVLTQQTSIKRLSPSVPVRSTSTTSLPELTGHEVACGSRHHLQVGLTSQACAVHSVPEEVVGSPEQSSVEIMASPAPSGGNGWTMQALPLSDRSNVARQAASRPYASLQGSVSPQTFPAQKALSRPSTGEPRIERKPSFARLRRSLSGSRASQSSEGLVGLPRQGDRDGEAATRASRSPFPTRVLLKATGGRISRSSSTSQPAAQDIHARSVAPCLDERDIEIHEEPADSAETCDLRDIRKRIAMDMAKQGNTTFGRRRYSRNLTPGVHTHELHSPVSEEGVTSMLSSDKERRKYFEAVDNVERNLTLEALAKTEMAYARIDVWTESRRGKWIVRNPAERDAVPADELPTITDPWAIPIDSKGIIRRKKLKSNVEITSTRTTVVCPDCRKARAMGVVCDCKSCSGSERVVMVYTVQCTVRLAEFTPLLLPAALVTGTKQPHIKYIDSTDPDHRADVLRDRAIDGLQSAASRVLKAHAEQHGSRLLMGRVTILRRGLLTVGATSTKSKNCRYYDVEDGPEGRIVEVTDKIKQASQAHQASGAAAMSTSARSTGNSQSKSDDHELRHRTSITAVANLFRQPPVGYRSSTGTHITQMEVVETLNTPPHQDMPLTPPGVTTLRRRASSRLTTINISPPQPTAQTKAAIADMQTDDVKMKAHKPLLLPPPRRAIKALFGK